VSKGQALGFMAESIGAIALATAALGVAIEAIGPTVLGWLGLGGVAAESPQGQSAIQALEQEGQALLAQEAQLQNALNQAAANALKAMQQVDSANTPLQNISAQEQAAAAARAYEEALKAWADFFSQCGH